MSSARAYDFMALRRQWAAIEEDTRTPAGLVAAASRGPSAPPAPSKKVLADVPAAPPDQPHHQQQRDDKNEGEETKPKRTTVDEKRRKEKAPDDAKAQIVNDDLASGRDEDPTSLGGVRGVGYGAPEQWIAEDEEIQNPSSGKMEQVDGACEERGGGYRAVEGAAPDDAVDDRWSSVYEASDAFVASLQQSATLYKQKKEKEIKGGEREGEGEGEEVMEWFAKYYQPDEGSSAYEDDDQVHATVTNNKKRSRRTKGKKKKKKVATKKKEEEEQKGSESEDEPGEAGDERYKGKEQLEVSDAYVDIDENIKAEREYRRQVRKEREEAEAEAEASADSSDDSSSSGASEQEAGEADEDQVEDGEGEVKYVLRAGMLVDRRKHHLLLAGGEDRTTDDEDDDPLQAAAAGDSSSSDSSADSSDSSDDEARQRRNRKKKDRWQRDWNEEWQTVLGLSDTRQRHAELARLSRDFVDTASKYGLIIISELFLPDAKKTIQPAAVGGIAGGQKYIVRGIFFKLAFDFKLGKYNSVWMYGGEKRSDEFAIKASGHELKSLIMMHRACIPDLYCPLMCTVDYRGFRLVCCSVLPISSSTLCYGSNDGGLTVLKKEAELSRKVEQACKWLHLKQHIVGKDVTLYGPGDLEGHKGQDGRFYVVDLARLFPAEAPRASESLRCIFYNLLRPELVRSNSVPLSSDAFSQWAKGDPESRVHNMEVLEATRRLHESVIPQLASELDRMLKPDNALQVNLSYEFHRRGVNMRHLGKVRKHASNEFTKEFLLTEMAARVFKNKLRQLLRDRMRRIKISYEEPYKALTINFINTMLRHQPFRVDSRPIAWLSLVASLLSAKFRMSFENDEDVRVLLQLNLYLLMRRFADKVGIVLSDRFWTHLQGYNKRFQPPLVVQPDLIQVNTRSKHMGITELAEAMVLYEDAEDIVLENPPEAHSLLLSAAETLRHVIASGYNDIDFHLTLAKTYHRLGQLTRNETITISGNRSQVVSNYLTLSAEAFDLCLSKPDLPASGHLYYGMLLCTMLKLPLALEQITLALAKDASLLREAMQAVEKWMSTRGSYLDPVDQLILASCLAKASVEVFPECAEALVLRGLVLCRTLTFRDYTLYGYVCYCDPYNQTNVKQEMLRQAAHHFDTALTVSEGCLDAIIRRAVDSANDALQQQERAPSVAVLSLMARTSAGLRERLVPALAEIKEIRLEGYLAGCGSVTDWEEDEITAVLALHPGLEKIHFANLSYKLTDVWVDEGLLKHADTLVSLTDLTVPYNTTMTHVTRLTRLRELSVAKARDHQLAAFAQLTSLRRLELGNGCEMTKDDFALLCRNNPGLAHVGLTGCSTLEDDSLSALADHCGESLRSVDFKSQYSFTPAGLDLLFAKSPRLRVMRLSLHSAVWCAETFAHLPTAMEHVFFEDIDNAAVVLQALRDKCANWRTLELVRCQLDTAALESLFGGGLCTQLTALGLRMNHRLSSDALTALAHLPALTHLDLAGCTNIDDSGLVLIAEHCKQLKTLDVGSLKRITTNGLLPVLQNNARTLVDLFVEDCTGLDADVLFNNLPPGLERLNCQQIVKRDQSLKALAFACPKLTWLSLRGGAISDFGFKMLTSNPPCALAHLRVDDCYDISDVGLSYLTAGAPKLRVLELTSAAKLSIKALHDLCKRRPKLRLIRSPTMSVPLGRLLFSHDL